SVPHYAALSSSHPSSLTLLPYTTLFRSNPVRVGLCKIYPPFQVVHADHQTGHGIVLGIHFQKRFFPFIIRPIMYMGINNKRRGVVIGFRLLLLSGCCRGSTGIGGPLRTSKNKGCR